MGRSRRHEVRPLNYSQVDGTIDQQTGASETQQAGHWWFLPGPLLWPAAMAYSVHIYV